MKLLVVAHEFTFFYIYFFLFINLNSTLPKLSIRTIFRFQVALYFNYGI